MIPCDQRSKVLIEGVAADTSQPDRVAHGDAPMRACEFDNEQRWRGQCCQHNGVALDFQCETADRLGQRMTEKLKPRLPVGRGGANRALRLPQRQVNTPPAVR